MASKGRSCLPSSVAFTIYSASVRHFFFVGLSAPIVIKFSGWLDQPAGGLLSWLRQSCRYRRQSQYFSSGERGWAPAFRSGA